MKEISGVHLMEGGRKVLVAQSCLFLCDPVDYSSPGSSVQGTLQTRILEWVAILFSWRPSRPPIINSLIRTCWGRGMEMMGKKSKTLPPRAGRSNTTSRDDGNTPHLPSPLWSPQPHMPNQDLQCDLCESVLVWASLVAQMAKNPPTMQDTWTLSLGQTIPWRRKRQPTAGLFTGRPQYMGSQRLGNEWQTATSHFGVTEKAF